MSKYFRYFPTTNYMNRTVTDITRRVKIIDDIRRDPYGFLPYTVTGDDRPEHIAQYYYGDANKVWMVYLANNIVDPYTQWPMSNSDFDKTIRAKYTKPTQTFKRDSVNLTSNAIDITNHGYKTTDPVIYTATSNASPLVSGNTYYVIRVNDNRIKLATSATNAKNGTDINITTAPNVTHSLEFDIEVFLMSTSLTSNIVYVQSNDDPTIHATLDTYLADAISWTPVRVYEYEVEQNESRRAIWLINKAYANQLETDLKRVLNE